MLSMNDLKKEMESICELLGVHPDNMSSIKMTYINDGLIKFGYRHAEILLDLKALT